ncbi:transcription factor jumonji, jmjC domain-containing protein [Trypanosoma conorhini]|uniref:Transcription factor jumonji, jmjC domain-containing protein n=1 Tax=Trypanosoma conorhini TaxID=83891 RepID=A0A3R7NY00_9TRYP|nr:transcription factor jumonji, jmjC domain-containing protein [Trypanosoma conorhini]RNF13697.1 transcription factor jumonji, jmjC domain-containing protein [Trypanosoma conorhini]
MSHAAGEPRPATVAEAFANTARALDQFSIERIRVEGLSRSSRSGTRGEREAEQEEVRTLTEQAFMREFVFQSRPCVIVGALEDWPAMRRWRDDAYLFDLDGHFARGRQGTAEAAAPPKDDADALADASGPRPREREATDDVRRVTVALTPNGRADAVTYVTHRGAPKAEADASSAEDAVVTEKLFMCAAEVRATLPELYQLLCANPAHPPVRPVFVDLRRPAPVVAYAQMQNNCLEVEYQHLHGDISTALDRFGERVFGGPHEAANVWFGTPASVSSMHQDWVENLYAVVRGVKEFILIPPWEGAFVPKPELPSAAFAVRREDGEGGEGGEGGYAFAGAPVRDGLTVPWMDVEFTPAAVEDAALLPANLRERLHPLVAYVQPGEVLYLPAMWLHRVAQHADEDDRRARENPPADAQRPPLPLIAAVNYWYEMNFTNPAVVMLREFGLLL